MKKLSIKCAMLCLVGLGCAGCVAQGQHDKIMQQYRQTEEQNEQLRWDLSEARTRLKVLEERVKEPDQDLLNDLAAAREEVTRQEAALQEAEQRTAMALIQRFKSGHVAVPVAEHQRAVVEFNGHAYEHTPRDSRKKRLAQGSRASRPESPRGLPLGRGEAVGKFDQGDELAAIPVWIIGTRSC